MNLLETYLCVSGASFTVYELLILKNNLEEFKKAKKNLKYKKLSKRSKIEKVKASKDLIENIGLLNAVGVGFALCPFNVVAIPYLVKNQDVLKNGMYEKLNKKYDKINKIEKQNLKLKKLVNKIH